MLLYLRKHRFIVFLVILFLLLRLPSLFEPYWYGDEGIYLTLGQAIRNGLILFRQVHDNKPPTLYYLAAIGQTVFGFRLLLLFFMAIANVIFYLFVQKITDKKTSKIALIIFLIISSIPLIEGNIANAEIFMVLPTILGFYVFFFLESRIKYLLSGLLLGFAFTIKVPVAVEFGFLFLWLFLVDFSFNNLVSRVKNLFIFSFGFILPIFLWAIYFALNHALSEFLFAALLQNFGYLSSWATGSHSGSATSGGLMTRVLILFIAWIVLYALYFKKKIDKYTFLLFGWFAATIFGALLSSRPYPHYLIQIIPPFSLIIALLLRRKIIHLVPILILVPVLVGYKFYYYEPITYYLNFYQYALGLRSVEKYNNHFSTNLNNTNQVASYIKNHSNSSDRIFIWGDEPYIYPLSDRLPAAKYTVAYHIVDFNQHQFVYQQLVSSFPKFIVYYSMNNRPYPQLDGFLKKYYSPVVIIGNATIYQDNASL